MKTKSFKRVTSLILTLAMLFSLAPASFAVDDPIDVSDDVVVSDVGNADQAADTRLMQKSLHRKGRKLPLTFLLTKKLRILSTMYPPRQLRHRILLITAFPS